jgi:hypothetical protein
MREEEGARRLLAARLTPRFLFNYPGQLYTYLACKQHLFDGKFRFLPPEELTGLHTFWVDWHRGGDNRSLSIFSK